MLSYAIFAVIFVVSLIAVVIYLYPSGKNPSTIPGLDPVSRDDGNMGDIAKAGSLHQFLMQLHKQSGPIASFWFGRKFVVSICSEKLFKEHHNVFDRPQILFDMFKPLLGAKSLTFTNGTDGRNRRHLYDKCLSHDPIKKYYELFQGVANEIAKKWEILVADEHTPLSQYMFAYALKAVLLSLYGETMRDDKEVLAFRKIFDQVWSEMELRLTEPPTEAREKALQQGRKQLNLVANKVLKERKVNPPKHGEELLLDMFIDYKDDEEMQFCDALTFLVSAYLTTGNWLTWGMYFLATHPDIQEKVYKEIKQVLGNEDVDHSNMAELGYLRQVLDETLRCAVVAPWAARFQDFDSELAGHDIPKNTPVIHALGVTMKDETVWPLPNKFDPDRFSPEETKKRPHLAFSPFGFAGKRICPGQKFAYTEVTVAMVSLLRKFKVSIVEGQVIGSVYGLVTHPSEEIWITISKR